MGLDKKSGFKRRFIQVLSTLIGNSNLKGFAESNIYKGDSKALCAPFLNCYSCPGAVAGCPIGSFQAVAGSMKYNISFYVLGTMMTFGILMGRLICGFLCPFGFIQDLLHKIPSPKFKVAQPLKYLKYVFLFGVVLLLPIIFADDLGMADPYFCKYICPAGTLEAGVFLVAGNPYLQEAIGLLFYWKIGLSLLFVLSSVLVYRGFCKVVCPLGAFYALFNRWSFYRYQIDMSKCIGCGKCKNTCKMDVDPVKNANHPECIRCGECIGVCPTKAIASNLKLVKKPVKQGGETVES